MWYFQDILTANKTAEAIKRDMLRYHKEYITKTKEYDNVYEQHTKISQVSRSFNKYM